jgi:hypothetical protein
MALAAMCVVLTFAVSAVVLTAQQAGREPGTVMLLAAGALEIAAVIVLVALVA